jgi:hypothetical protein
MRTPDGVAAVKALSKKERDAAYRMFQAVARSQGGTFTFARRPGMAGGQVQGKGVSMT